MEPIAVIRRRNKWKWRLLGIWIILMSAAVIWGYYANQSRIDDNQKINQRQINDNKNRINDIQDSRLSSCKQTFEGIREVFKPFEPKKGEKSTPEQRRNWIKFNNTIDKLKAKCSAQVKPNK